MASPGCGSLSHYTLLESLLTPGHYHRHILSACLQSLFPVWLLLTAQSHSGPGCLALLSVSALSRLRAALTAEGDRCPFLFETASAPAGPENFLCSSSYDNYSCFLKEKEWLLSHQRELHECASVFWLSILAKQRTCFSTDVLHIFLFFVDCVLKIPMCLRGTPLAFLFHKYLSILYLGQSGAPRDNFSLHVTYLRVHRCLS